MCICARCLPTLISTGADCTSPMTWGCNGSEQNRHLLNQSMDMPSLQASERPWEPHAPGTRPRTTEDRRCVAIKLSIGTLPTMPTGTSRGDRLRTSGFIDESRTTPYALRGEQLARHRSGRVAYVHKYCSDCCSSLLSIENGTLAFPLCLSRQAEGVIAMAGKKKEDHEEKKPNLIRRNHYQGKQSRQGFGRGRQDVSS